MKNVKFGNLWTVSLIFAHDTILLAGLNRDLQTALWQFAAES